MGRPPELVVVCRHVQGYGPVPKRTEMPKVGFRHVKSVITQ